MDERGLRRREAISRCLPPFLILAVISAFPAAGAQAPGATDAVNCYDPVTESVERQFRDQCHGQAVSDDQAAVIRQKRSDYVRRAMQRNASPLASSLRLAGIGTAFFVGHDGTLISNSHVTKDCRGLTVETAGGTPVVARLLAQRPADDLALVKADIAPPAVAIFRRPVEMTGQNVLAAGYPVRGLVPINPQYVDGALNGPRDASNRRFMFRADIRPGNSGGPLLDEQGLVVGVVFAKVDTVKVYQKTGKVVRDLGYGIDNEVVVSFLEETGIKAETATAAPVLEHAALLDLAGKMTVRLSCWR